MQYLSLGNDSSKWKQNEKRDPCLKQENSRKNCNLFDELDLGYIWEDSDSVSD